MQQADNNSSTTRNTTQDTTQDRADRSYRVAVVGATGAVGQEMIKTLESRSFPMASVKLLASERSAGQKVTVMGKEISVEVLCDDSFGDVDIALFSAGGSVSKRFSPLAAKQKCLVIDNSSAFRMDPQIPLVVPEVNAAAAKDAVANGRYIIANPNCSTIQMVVVLKPLHDAFGLRRVVVSTYQAAGGAGQKGISELETQTRHWASGEKISDPKIFSRQLLFDVIPQIGDYCASGYTTEEEKMMHETRKIMSLPDLRVSATTVRVPVMIGHSESINVEFEQAPLIEQARDILASSPGVSLIDDLENGQFPVVRDAIGSDETFVGRIRRDVSQDNGLDLWVVSDNLRKGAALNAVQIAEYVCSQGIL